VEREYLCTFRKYCLVEANSSSVLEAKIPSEIARRYSEKISLVVGKMDSVYRENYAKLHQSYTAVRLENLENTVHCNLQKFPSKIT
jgi:hypothetical protein